MLLKFTAHFNINIVISSILLFILHCTIYAKEITVSPNGKISSIKSAINIADDEDVILIKQGYYAEGNIIVNKSVSIIGENFPVIDGKGDGEVFTIIKDSVHIKGLVIKNSGISYLEENAGIRLEEVQHCSIIGNKFINNFFAIYLAKSSNSYIDGNYIKGIKKEKQTPVTEFIFGIAEILLLKITVFIIIGMEFILSL